MKIDASFVIFVLFYKNLVFCTVVFLKLQFSLPFDLGTDEE